MKINSNLELNEKLPDNVWVHEFGMKQFQPMLRKMDNLWTGIVLPKDIKEDDFIPWCMAYLNYEIDGKNKYLIWFFDNCDYPTPHVTDRKIIYKEVMQFLKDEEEIRKIQNEDSSNI